LKLNEAITLLDAITLHLSTVAKKPGFAIFQELRGNYSLRAKPNFIEQESRDYLKELVKSRGLQIRESVGYLTIYGSL